MNVHMTRQILWLLLIFIICLFKLCESSIQAPHLTLLCFPLPFSKKTRRQKITTIHNPPETPTPSSIDQTNFLKNFQERIQEISRVSMIERGT
ncbi:hypothetical protein L6452_16473 [Arctium lappa]|uniref:Uncharacterized protein n=1 Tax=Arctium lappa TaxID=4217 RepID=A0ACB9C0T9_ARCLA|nr:hypothetical protein L6452_16473 [Arctium lappa]